MKGRAFDREGTEAFRGERICVIEQWAQCPLFIVCETVHISNPLSGDVVGVIRNFQLKNPKLREIRFLGREHTYSKTEARLQVPYLPVQLLLIGPGRLAVCWTVRLVGRWEQDWTGQQEPEVYSVTIAVGSY